MKIRHAAALALVFCACSTAPSRSIPAGWIGQPESSLVAYYGKPEETSALPDGGKIDVFMMMRVEQNYEPTVTCRDTFTLDAARKVSDAIRRCTRE
jgi:hypothetical protein